MADLPPGLDWLGATEKEHLASLRVEKRRREWLLGRWTAKQALLRAPDCQLAAKEPSQLEILPSQKGQPKVYQLGQPDSISLSLSHRAGSALCMVWSGGSLGCDLELVEERSAGFVEDYFTASEQSTIRAAGTEEAALMANSLWSAKESLLKLLGIGLTADTRLLTVQEGPEPSMEGWRPFTVSYAERSGLFRGWWLRREEWVLTVATDPASGPPVEISKRVGEKG